MKIGNEQFNLELTQEDVWILSALIPKRVKYFFNKKIISRKCYFRLKELLEADIKQNGHYKFSTTKTYKSNPDIVNFLDDLYPFIKNKVKTRFIKEYKIENYNAADVFVAGMNLLVKELNQGDINEIYWRAEGRGDNPQFSRYYFYQTVLESNGIPVSKQILDDYKNFMEK